MKKRGRGTDSSHPSPGYLRDAGKIENKKEKTHPATSLKLETSQRTRSTYNSPVSVAMETATNLCQPQAALSAP